MSENPSKRQKHSSESEAEEVAVAELRNELPTHQCGILEANEATFLANIHNSGAVGLNVAAIKCMLKLSIEAVQAREEAAQAREEAAQAREEAAKSREDLERISLAGLLALENSEKFKFNAVGFDSSHLSPKHVPARILKRCFVLDHVHPQIAGERVLVSESSNFLGVAHKASLSYGVEADIQGWVYGAIVDAVFLANALIEARSSAGDVKRRLETRRECSLLSQNKPDHTVIYDRESGYEILVIEDKKPHAKVPTSEKVAGQIFDYLCANAVFGHPNPFVILTTCQCSWVAWMDIGRSNEIAAKQNRLSDAELNQLVSSLPSKSAHGKKNTPSPPKLVEVEADQENVHVAAAKPAHEDQLRSTSFRRIERKVMLSDKSYEPHQLVPLICNAIFCGLQNVTGQKEAMVLQDGSMFSHKVLKLTKDGYEWLIVNLKVNGPARLLQGQEEPPEEYCAFELAGTGVTSRVLRALTMDGKHCVIKMYVRKYVDGGKPLSDTEYKTNARESVRREVETYHTLYPELKDYVWEQELNGVCCVILPYFMPIPKEERETTVDSVRDILNQKFRPERYRFDDSDMQWRHVGTFDGTVYLFDLADLKKEGDSSTFDSYIDQHCQTLQDKRIHSEVATENIV